MENTKESLAKKVSDLLEKAGSYGWPISPMLFTYEPECPIELLEDEKESGIDM